MPAMPAIAPGADVAALRRYLVDGGYATRAGMVYRRVPSAGPPREVPAGPPWV
jgi:hypothetical protein